MSRQQNVVASLVVALLLTTGWLLNDAYRYIASVFDKATVCDEIQCLDQQELALKIEEMQLPVTKERTR